MAIKSDLMRYLYQFKEWSMQFDIRALLRNSSLWGKPAPDKLPIPPARFRIKVTGTADIDWFLTSGELAFNSMVTVLSWRNIDLENLKSVLDFGCGCGRVLRYWFNYQNHELYGCDYNPQLVQWCQQNLPNISTQSNPITPPLEYPNSKFDFIYALSVFTHLTEAEQFIWRDEMLRILKPGGYLMISTRGVSHYSDLTIIDREQFDIGQLVVRNPELSGTNLCSAYHPQEFLWGQFAEGFELLEYAKEGAMGNPFQDLCLLKKIPLINHH